MRKTLASLAVAALLVVGIPVSAFAEEGYTPRTSQEPTLAGSTAVGECRGDVPWISFTVDLTDPDNQSTGHTARLVMTDGTNSHTIELGPLVNNHLSGRVLWPGASVDAQGVATGWPGWAFVNGQWVETSGNFQWTRGAISAHIEVNPELAVPLSYPPATPICATDPRTPSLAASGLNAAVLPIGIVGGLAVLVGAAFVVARRRSRADS